MGVYTRGFHGHRRQTSERVPPGQYLTEDFPVLSAGPTPEVPAQEWAFTIAAEDGGQHTWTWDDLMDLPQEEPVVDIHCVTRWSKLDTHWTGVSMDALLADVESAAEYALVSSYDGYTADLPVQDLTDGRAWVVHTYGDEVLSPEHGGPVRLLVPHLYLWKSAKWLRGLQLLDEDHPGFWEQAGYHGYGDPWREQRYRGD